MESNQLSTTQDLDKLSNSYQLVSYFDMVAQDNDSLQKRREAVVKEVLEYKRRQDEVATKLRKLHEKYPAWVEELMETGKKIHMATSNDSKDANPDDSSDSTDSSSSDEDNVEVPQGSDGESDDSDDPSWNEGEKSEEKK